MPRFRRSSRVHLLLAAALLPLPLAAQGERVTLRAMPAPNQVIRIGITQQMAFDVAADAMPSGPMKVEGSMFFRGTQRMGSPDAAGRVTAELSYDSVSVELNMNGAPLPMGNQIGESLVGKTFTLVYGPDGKVVEVQVPENLQEMAGTMKDMMSSLGGYLPNAALAVGDTVTVPVSFAIPIPGLAGPGQPSGIESRITYKLVAIERDGPDRIARLDQQIEGAMSGALEMRMSGTGTVEWNVDRGFIKSGVTDQKLEMTMQIPGAAGTMRITGTIHMVMTGSRE